MKKFEVGITISVVKHCQFEVVAKSQKAAKAKALRAVRKSPRFPSWGEEYVGSYEATIL